MKLLKCHIENFGKLQDLTISFSDGLNVFRKENGWGKSTLAAFLKVMFYGFANESKRSVTENERKRYKPWQGGVYGGQLWFEAKGKKYELVRTFGTKEREDTFALYDAVTGLESGDYSAQIGMELFELDAASFARTVFLAQQECRMDVTDGIHAKLGNLTTEQEDIGQYEMAQKRLTELWNKWSPTRKTGMLSRLQQEVTELEAKQLQSAAVGQELETVQIQKRQWKENVERFWEEQKQQQKKQADEASWQSRKVQKEWYERLCREVQKKQEEYEQACAVFSKEQPSKEQMQQFCIQCQKWTQDRWREQEQTDAMAVENKTNRGMSILYIGLLALLAGGLMWLFHVAGYAVAGILGGILIVLGVLQQKTGEVSSRQAQSNRKDAQQLEKEKEKLEREIKDFLVDVGYEKQGETSYSELAIEIEKQWNICEYKQTELRRAKEEKQRFEEEHAMELALLQQEKEEPESMLQEIESLQEKIREGEIQVQRLGQREMELQQQMEEGRKREEKLQQLYAEQKTLAHQYEVVAKTRQLLEEAKEHLTARYRNPVEEAFCRYYELLTQKTAEPMEIDANLTLQVREKGEHRAMDLFSAGTKDLAGICMRLALVDAMYQGEQPFLVLDDPFVNLDEGTLRRALEFLCQIAKERQILYFTCHSSRITPC